MLVVSACLIGENCKYNGKNNKNEKLLEFLKDKEYITVCPEEMGGLPTPRVPSEIEEGNSGYEVVEGLARVVSKDGRDVTKEYLKGAKDALEEAKLARAQYAILKEGSPSCGGNFIHDGRFIGVKKQGCGVTTALFRKNNIKVVTEKEDFAKILEK